MTEELFRYYFDRFKDIKPQRPRVEESQKGVNFMIFYLGYYNDKEIFAGDIANQLECSTARVTALINRLEKKNIIIKEHDLVDKRKTRVRLTEIGLAEYEARTKIFKEYLSRILETIGKEELDKFLTTLSIINRIGDEILC